jgi:aldehyde dehydrogenase (NAD+)
MMDNTQKFYIRGQWVNPLAPNRCDVINPANEEVCAHISLGSEADVDVAVMAARDAFLSYGQTTRQERMAMFDAIIQEYKKRYDDLVQAVVMEMGAPITLARNAQVAVGLRHLETARAVLETFEFKVRVGNSQVYKEPIGVCGLITPWNWPLNQITCKVAPALATGCTMVLKPSEVAPLSGIIFAEIMDKAGVPAGVFNLVNGDGLGVGTALSSHPQVDMISFTGSTRAGSLVAQHAAATIKRVTQELGGKSANIILDDAPFEEAIQRGTTAAFINTGQSCNAPTRMLVPAEKLSHASKLAAEKMDAIVVGDPMRDVTTMGPLVSQVQFDKVQDLIQQGMDEGAELVCGGVGRPEGMPRGYFVKPTVFSHVDNQMRIAQEEIFGPVLSIIPYNSDDEAIEIANDSLYGLAGYIQGMDMKRVTSIASKIRAGNININGHTGDFYTPFGGFKHSGNGREWGAFGFEDYLEIKALSGLE